MLGRLIGGARWEWAVFGKHPVAKDYFQINLVSPMATAFAQWVDSGFRRLSEDQRRHTACSWRFWAKGQKRGAMTCGLGKCSSDSIGRPYPLMIVGEGTLPQWEQYWQLMLASLQSTWESLEYAASRRLRGLDHLETVVRSVPAPRSQWLEAASAVCPDDKDPLTGCRKVFLTDACEKAKALDADGALLVELDGDDATDPFQLASAWHVALKACGMPAPTTAFMGGRPDKSVLALFRRPLMTDDFSSLWSI